MPGGGPTTFVPAAGIPTLGAAGFAALVALLVMAAVYTLERRRARGSGAEERV